MAFLDNRRQGDHLSHSSDSLPLRRIHFLLLLFILLPFLLQVECCVLLHFIVFCSDLWLAGNLLSLRVIGAEVLGLHLDLELLDLSELLPLVPQFLEQRDFEWALRVRDINLSFREAGLLVLLAIFCSVFFGLGGALHILINLS